MGGPDEKQTDYRSLCTRRELATAPAWWVLKPPGNRNGENQKPHNPRWVCGCSCIAHVKADFKLKARKIPYDAQSMRKYGPSRIRSGEVPPRTPRALQHACNYTTVTTTRHNYRSSRRAPRLELPPTLTPPPLLLRRAGAVWGRGRDVLVQVGMRALDSMATSCGIRIAAPGGTCLDGRPASAVLPSTAKLWGSPVLGRPSSRSDAEEFRRLADFGRAIDGCEGRVTGRFRLGSRRLGRFFLFGGAYLSYCRGRIGAFGSSLAKLMHSTLFFRATVNHGSSPSENCCTVAGTWLRVFLLLDEPRALRFFLLVSATLE